MKIGLINIDSRYPNLALMKISSYYKSMGYDVELYQPLLQTTYDLIFASKVFSHTKFGYLPKNAIVGGTGFNLKSILPYPIEHKYPDYDLFKVTYAMGYLTRGCNNNCGFCVVHEKEGNLHKSAELEEFWRDQKEVMLLDNSLTDYTYAAFELQKMIDNNIRLNLTQGFNVRTITPTIAKLLANIPTWRNKQWHIAWDQCNDERRVLRGISILLEAGIPAYKLLCLLIVGFNSTPKEDLYRIKTLEKLGVDPFVMQYKKTSYTRALAKWCNNKPVFKSSDFTDYIKNRGDYKEIIEIMG